jgi:hypothetical protein
VVITGEDGVAFSADRKEAANPEVSSVQRIAVQLTGKGI